MTFSRPDTQILRSSALGARFPASVHAITCSIPTMRDVIGYEEKNPETMEFITSGYPRFVLHFYIREMIARWREERTWGDRRIFVAGSERLAMEAVDYCGDEFAAITWIDDGIWAIDLPANSPGAPMVKAFLQHTGGGISSRRAERYLLDRGLLSSIQNEDRADAKSADSEIRAQTGQFFGAPAENVMLASSGMNALYAVFRAINAIQEKRGRDEWVQLGWLYVDTIKVLSDLNRGAYHAFDDVLDIGALEKLLADRAGRIAAIVTEAPTNPLVQTPDIYRLRELARRFEIPLVVDPTLASPCNLDVLPLCDVVVNSLTKYAASAGDVMMGAAVINPDSAFAAEIQANMGPWLIPPFSEDLRRMAVEIRSCPSVVEQINANTCALSDFLQSHSAVEKIYGAYSGDSGMNYARIARKPDSPGGILTIKLRQPIGEFFDQVNIPKGPSFGLDFTIICPFLYLAHYDLVTSDDGIRRLQRANLHPELLRISVGVEQKDAIIAAFKEGFQAK